MLLPEKYESGLRSKRRRYFHIFQVEAYLTYCEDIYRPTKSLPTLAAVV